MGEGYAENPHEQLRAAVREALARFDEIRRGELDCYIDRVGMSAPDENVGIMVTVQNVDAHELQFVEDFAWLLDIESDDQS